MPYIARTGVLRFTQYVQAWCLIDAINAILRCYQNYTIYVESTDWSMKGILKTRYFKMQASYRKQKYLCLYQKIADLHRSRCNILNREPLFAIFVHILLVHARKNNYLFIERMQFCTNNICMQAITELSLDAFIFSKDKRPAVNQRYWMQHRLQETKNRLLF